MDMFALTVKTERESESESTKCTGGKMGMGGVVGGGLSECRKNEVLNTSEICKRW